MDRSATYDFLLTLRSNHEPISYRFRDKRRKYFNFSHPVYLTPPLMGFALELGTSAGGQKKTRVKFDDIFRRLDRMHQHEEQITPLMGEFLEDITPR